MKTGKQHSFLMWRLFADQFGGHFKPLTESNRDEYYFQKEKRKSEKINR